MSQKESSSLGLAALAAALSYGGPLMLGDTYDFGPRRSIPVAAKPKGKDRTKIKAARKQKHRGKR